MNKKYLDSGKNFHIYNKLNNWKNTFSIIKNILTNKIWNIFEKSSCFGDFSLHRGRGKLDDDVPVNTVAKK